MDWAATKLEENGEEIAEAFLAAVRNGEWRAGAFLYERVYGRPQERVTLDPASVDPLGIREMTIEQRAQLRARLLEEHPELAEMAAEIRGSSGR